MIKKKPDFLKNRNNRIILIILIIGTMFMLFPTTKKKEEVPEKSIDVTDDEERLERILSGVKGAGKVSVMVTYAKTFEQNPAYEIKSDISNRGETGYEENSERQLVTVDGEPVILSQTYPKVKGVVVTAEGAANPKVKADILDAVGTAFGIASHKICILEKN